MKDSMMTDAECTKLIEALLQDAEYHPYAVYGLIFLFSSIKQNSILLEDFCFHALKTLYTNSENIEIGIERITSDIHNLYRNADFTKDYAEIIKPFLEAESKMLNKEETQKEIFHLYSLIRSLKKSAENLPFFDGDNADELNGHTETVICFTQIAETKLKNIQEYVSEATDGD